MKPFLSIVFLVVFGFAFSGCGPPKVKGPAPDPVGQWIWSDQKLGSWRLEIKRDGTFQREITYPAGQKSAIHGQWTIYTVTQKEPSWLERHRPFQKHRADDEPASHTQRSALGMLTFHYSTPELPKLLPNPPASEPPATKPADSPATPASEMIVGETQTVRTYFDTKLGLTFLDVGGKKYAKDQTDEAH